MVKRIVIGIVCFLLIAVVYAVGSTILGGEPDAPEGAPATARQDVPWNGRLTKAYNTEFTRRGESLSVLSAQFSSLELARADVTVILSIDLGGGRPSWLRPSEFRGYQVASGRTYVPEFSVRNLGSSAELRLLFKDIPTAALGPTCTQIDPEQVDRLYLRILGLPGGEADVALNAPAPPANTCLANPETIAAEARRREIAARGVTITSVRTKRHRLFLSGRVTVDGLEELKIEFGRRGQFRVLKTLKPQPRFQVTLPLGAGGPGRYQMRIGVSDQEAGELYPRAARRTLTRP